MLFSDQVEVLATWFKNWNECEQTVALFSLLKRMKKCQAKFLWRCLEHILNDCPELLPMEDEANDNDFVSRLFNEPQQAEVIKILLTHLPLLKPGNDIAKHRYLEILPNVLAFAIERSEYLEESRQLLSYSLIHPAFDNKERNLLTSWMSGLDGRMASEQEGERAEEEVSPDISSRSNSLEIGVSLGDLNRNCQPDDTASLSHSLTNYANHCADPSAVSPSISTSSDYNSLNNNEKLADGMTDVRSWLKSLRLHKYSELFSSMTYEEMMELTSEKLDQKNVTKGARNKIILSINKLKERFNQLLTLEKEILGGGSLRACLTELKSLIQTPIKKFEGVDSSGGKLIEDEDIPSQYTKVMGKACTQLLVSKPDEENITLYMKLLERCIQHPAFSEPHKRRLRTWKQQVNKMYRSLTRNTRPPSQSRSQHSLGYAGLRRQARSQFSPHTSNSAPRPLNPLSSPPLRTMSLGYQQQQQNMNWFNNVTPATSQSNIVDPTRKSSSLDPRVGHRLFPEVPTTVAVTTEPPNPANEINSRLDSLCLSVAEHALGDGPDPVQTL